MSLEDVITRHCSCCRDLDSQPSCLLAWNAARATQGIGCWETYWRLGTVGMPARHSSHTSVMQTAGSTQVCRRPGGCTCRALGVCLQGEREGLGSLECEGGHASPHDWQVARPCNVVHADLARGAQGAFMGCLVRPLRLHVGKT